MFNQGGVVPLKYQAESWKDAGDEISRLVVDHYLECDVTDGAFPLSLDTESLDKMSDAGLLHVFTARENELAGYVVNLVMPRHNTFDAKYAAQLGWFVAKNHRKGSVGKTLLERAEEDLKTLGVKASFASHPVHNDLSPLLERMGWKKCEINYFKRID